MSTGRLVFTVFVVLQVADGLMTYGAVSIFGVVAEGNPLLQTWIHLAGAGPALFGAKLLACGCGAVLYLAGARKTLGALSAFYLFGAIGPWLHALSLNF
jgi:hypothetical protein